MKIDFSFFIRTHKIKYTLYTMFWERESSESKGFDHFKSTDSTWSDEELESFVNGTYKAFTIEECSTSHDYDYFQRYLNFLHGKSVKDFVLSKNRKYMGKFLDKLELACQNGSLITVQFLYEVLGLTLEDFRLRTCVCARLACMYGHLDIVKYLHATVGLTAEDFRSEWNLGLQNTCEDGHLDVVKYLYEHISLTVKDFQEDNNLALRSAQENGHREVVKYLKDTIRVEPVEYGFLSWSSY